jgi:hypothetical protein
MSDYLLSEWHRLTAIDHAAAAFHDHIADDLFAIAEFLNKIADKGCEIDFEIDQVLL